MNGITGQLHNGAIANGLFGACGVVRLVGLSAAAMSPVCSDQNPRNLKLRAGWDQSEYYPEAPVPSPPRAERSA